ncbi:putative carboxylesterase [Rosa chinensis]|uniref:Putative carboxylesterase n=1 Tax=Rosa chinensis TaxID=74649 RepID=A0A2P6SGC7_ROSCH|nr:probable carboxylesterase 9 [Rosa chinensis]PRQ57719.1 putative carboxylesterase [Rosa chinensis]
MSKFDPYTHLNIVHNPVDDTLTRLISLPTTDANPNPSPGDPVASKDLTLNSETKTWVRIFRPSKLPSNDNTVARLPIIIYFHHGGWLLLSAADSSVHSNCSFITSQVPAILVSVNYRLAPEARLPAQYDDAMEAIHWVKKQGLDPGGEQWIRDYGDLSRCYLYGCGCGGNIVFFSALKAYEMKLDLEPMQISGIIMNQPMFGGIQRTKSELKFATDQLLPLPVLDLMWDLALPKSTDRNHRYCSPALDAGRYKEMIQRLGRCLVIGFGGDPMVDRQQEFVTMLVSQGIRVDARFDNLGFHNIDFVDQRRAAEVLDIVKEFII